MHKGRWVVVTVGLLLAGCKKDPELTPAGAAALAGQVTPEAVESATGDDAPYVLTAPKLAAYVDYQRKVQAAYAAMARELQANRARLLDAPAPGDAGTDKAPALSEGFKAIESKAEQEYRLRRESGLSEQDVNRIGALVTDVITQRHMAAMLDLSSELHKLEEMQARLKPEQAAELAPQISALRERVRETEQLVSVRRQYGDANVDLVLTREQELMANYQDMLRSFGGKSQ
jgi:hypothetical protein